MWFRLLVSVGLAGIGYLLGREAGRAQAIREHLGSSDRPRRIRGETFESSDYTVLDEEAGARVRATRKGRAGKGGHGDG
jgi:hypothetical protein